MIVQVKNVRHLLKDLVVCLEIIVIIDGKKIIGILVKIVPMVEDMTVFMIGVVEKEENCSTDNDYYIAENSVDIRGTCYLDKHCKSGDCSGERCQSPPKRYGSSYGQHCDNNLDSNYWKSCDHCEYGKIYKWPKHYCCRKAENCSDSNPHYVRPCWPKDTYLTAFTVNNNHCCNGVYWHWGTAYCK